MEINRTDYPTLRDLETSGSDYPLTQGHIPGKTKPSVRVETTYITH